ncbi:MAG: elongation factor G [Planctomyces sp.]|nr:elongation factor G [Planctomyces sp.]
MTTPIDKIRNIGIVAHIDAGKTTTTERILYYTGASHKMGDVDSGTTITDFDPEEARRGITIYSAAVTCRWRDARINLIDTPGHVDFTAEVERSLRVLDGAVVVFSAVEGVEAQSETVWRQADRYKVPRLCFINKLDRIGANFERTLKQLEDRLHGRPVVLYLPIGQGNEFRGIIDVVQRQALYFDEASLGRNIDVREVPEEQRDEVELWRTRLFETVAETDEALMEAYLADEPIADELLDAALRRATIERHVQPVFCGTSLHYVGVQPVLDGVVKYLPSPLDRPAISGIHPSPKKNQDPHETRATDPKAPFCGLVFKIVADKHADLCFVRVYSGVLKSGSRHLNPRTGKKEFVSQLWHVQADQRERIEMDQVEAGDIVGVIGPKEVVTGDTLCDASHPLLLETITFPETVISMAVEPDTSADRKKLEDALSRLSRQDPTFKAKVSEETGQTIISGMGELHLEVLKDRLQRDFNLKVKVHKPRVSYRETVRGPVTAEGEYARTVQGETAFAGVTLSLAPYHGDEPISVRSTLKPDALPQDLVRPLLQAVLESAQSGGVLGYPLLHVQLTIVDVNYKDSQTTEDALRAASAIAVQNALTSAEIALLEPVMKLEVVTPPEFVGNIQADLNIRHARIFGSEQRGHLTVLDAEVPLANMFGYSTHVRSLSQGRASYSMEPLKYDFAPDAVLREMRG